MNYVTTCIMMLILGLYFPDASSQQNCEVHKYLNQNLPGQIAELFAEGVISTEEYEHGSPAFSPSYDEIYWGVRINEKPGQEIINFIKRGDSGWSEVMNPSFSRMGNSDLYPVFSKGGQKLFFTSSRPDTSNPEMMNRCIWRVIRNESDWVDPEIVGFDSLDIYGLSVSAKGTLYFMAQMLNDRGTMRYDIYFSKLEKGVYCKPEKIGYPISTDSFEDGPYISDDETFLLFESTRPGGFGGNDLYLSTKTENGNWSDPMNLGKRINSEASERFPYISPDGNYFFFGSNRTGNYDIYWISASIIYSIKKNKWDD